MSAAARHRRLRLATWNVEWFNALFDTHDRLKDDARPSARHRVSRAEQAGAIAIVLMALDADGIMVIEAPDTSRSQNRSTVRALEAFARRFELRQSRAVTGFASDTEQEIAFLFDPDRISARHDPRDSPFAPRFDRPHRADLDGDGLREVLRFSKPPLELDLRFGAHALRLIGVHAKSKSPHGAVSEAEFRRIAIENRRKQLAECLWLRLRVEAHLAASEDLIVMGDFNDGPGLDEFEKLFGHSGVEVVMGLQALPEMRLFDPHADLVLSQRLGLTPTTARFWLAEKKHYFEALLDYIMVSPHLAAKRPAWRIWHPFNDPAAIEAPELREALVQASDHFPVTLELDL